MKRRDEVLVGILLTIGVVIAVLGTIWLVRGGFSSRLPAVLALQVGRRREAGSDRCDWPACRSASCRTSSSTPKGTILVKMSVEKKYHVPRNSVAAVVPVGIFGDQEIALTPAEPSPISFNPGDSVPPAPLEGRPPRAHGARRHDLAATR